MYVYVKWCLIKRKEYHILFIGQHIKKYLGKFM